MFIVCNDGCSCYRAFLYYDNIQYGGWAGSDGVLQKNFAGDPKAGQGCACAADNSCLSV